MGVVFIRHHHVAFNHFLFHHLAAFRLVIGPQKVAKRRVKVASVETTAFAPHVTARCS